MATAEIQNEYKVDVIKPTTISRDFVEEKNHLRIFQIHFQKWWKNPMVFIQWTGSLNQHGAVTRMNQDEKLNKHNLNCPFQDARS
jgi:hypothetical protein